MPSLFSITILIGMFAFSISASLADNDIPSRQFIDSNRHQILRDDDLLTKSLIILRLDGFYDEAIALGLDAERSRVLSRRHLYELALIHVAMGHCDLAKPYFQHLSADEHGDKTDWLAEDSKRFLRQCSRHPHLKWAIDISTGYDQNLAQTTAQQIITAEPESQLDQIIRQIESNLSGINISPDFTIGDRHVAGWYTETNASFGFVIPRKQGNYQASLLLYERLTTPRGYDRRGIGISGNWQYQTSWAILESQILLKRLENQRGQNRTSVIRHQSSASQAMIFPLSDIAYFRMAIQGSFETYPRQPDQTLQDQGIAFGYHQANPKANPKVVGANRTNAWWNSWYAEISTAKRITSPRDQSSDRLGITGLVHLIPPNAKEKLWIQLSLTKESLIHPRPWRLHRHNLWHVTSTLVFSPDWLDKYALNLELGWENTRSKDVLDEGQKWNFIVRYQLNNAKR